MTELTINLRHSVAEMNHNHLKNLIIIALVTTLALTFWELVLGRFVLDHPTIAAEAVWGRRFPPHAEVTWGTEGLARNRMDRMGFNNDDDLYESGRAFKAPLVILGDSHTEALQVPRQQNFASRLQVLLGGDATVINLGIGDNSLANYLLAAKEVDATFKPSLVIVQVTADDFFRDAMNDNKSVFIHPFGPRNFALTTNFTPSLPQKVKRKLERYEVFARLFDSSLIRYAYQRWLRFRENYNYGDTAKAQPSSTLPEVYADSLVDWEMRTLQKSFPNLLFVYLPKTPFLGDTGLVFEEPSEAKQIKALVERAAKNLGIGFVDLTGVFEKGFLQHKMFPRGFSNTKPGVGHLNSFGHMLVARGIKDHMMYEFTNAQPDGEL